MADQPSRQQPFRFWFRRNPTPTPLRPPVPTQGQPLPRAPTSRSPQPPTQPQSTSSAAPSQPPPTTTARRPSLSPSPSLTPSSSWRSSQPQPSDQRPPQRPSPALTTTQPPSPSSASSQLQPASRGDSKPPSQPSQIEPEVQTAAPTTSPGDSQPQPATQGEPRLPSPSKSLPRESQFPVETVSSTVPQPETQVQTTPQAPEQIPTQSDSQSTAAEKQTSQGLESKPTPTDSSTPIEPHTPESQTKEIKEGKPTTDLESKLETEPSPLPSIEEKPKEAPEEKPKPQAEVKQNKEPKLSIKVSDSKPRRAPPSTSQSTSEDTTSEPAHTKTQENVSGKESRIAISTIPRGSSGERTNFQKEIKEGLSKLFQKLSIGQQQPGGEETVSIITLAGENKGASMVVRYQGLKGEGSMHAHSGYKLERHEGGSNYAENGSPEITVSINSNVQSINNSVLNESPCGERNPGVHLTLSSKPTEPVYLKGRMESLTTQKTSSRILPAQKLAYEPNIRRRCLRGLLMESSESDPENTQKPRRHGCRFSCDEKTKGKANDAGAASTANRNGRHTEGKPL